MPAKNKMIYWAPRIMGLVFVLFLSLFALDIFGEYKGLESVLPFAVHLIPALVLLAAVIISWKRDLVGAVIFIGFAIFYVFSAGLGRPWSWYATIALPSMITGILFFANWLRNRKKR